MSNWGSTKSKRVLAALLKIGWTIKRQSGSHRTLSRDGWPDFVFAFHDREEIGPRMLARIAKRTGLQLHDIALRASQKSKVKSQKLTTTGFQLIPMS